MVMSPPPSDQEDREEVAGRGEDQPAADVALLDADIRMTTKKGKNSEYSGLMLGKRTSGGGCEDQGRERVRAEGAVDDAGRGGRQRPNRQGQRGNAEGAERATISARRSSRHGG